MCVCVSVYFCVYVCGMHMCVCVSYLITYTYILMSLLIIVLLFSNSLVYTIVKSGRNWRTRTYTFINKTSAVERRIINRSMNPRLSLSLPSPAPVLHFSPSHARRYRAVSRGSERQFFFSIWYGAETAPDRSSRDSFRASLEWGLFLHFHVSISSLVAIARIYHLMKTY